jgi:CDP-diacylglycerol--serine O-phosphatidyltransferase
MGAMNEHLHPAGDRQIGPDGPRRRFPVVPFRVLLPNFVTLLATCSGLTAIRFAIEGRYDWAIFAVVVAAILDALDGRLARLLKGTSRFGAELDSLSDFVNFGVVPALILYFFSLKDYRSIGWIVALVFAMAAALRLARFNVMLDDPDRPAFTKDFFVGMPAPAGALCALLPIYLHFDSLPRFPGLGVFELVYVLAIGALMVSRVPTYAGKTLGRRVPRQHVLPALILVVLFFVLLATFPFEMLTLMVVTYLAYLPLGAQRYRRLEAAHRAEVAAAAGKPPTA